MENLEAPNISLMDHLTRRAPAIKKAYELNLRYGQAMEQFHTALSAFGQLQELAAGNSCEPKIYLEEKYHEYTPGSWRNNVTIKAQKDDEGGFIVDFDSKYDNLVMYRSRRWREPDTSYHSHKRTLHEVRLDSNLNIVAVSSGKAEKTMSHFVLNPWDEVEYQAHLESVLDKEGQVRVVEEITNYLSRPEK